MNYVSTYDVLPASALFGAPRPAICRKWGHGPFVPMLNYLEQPAVFNAVNFAWPHYHPENVTIASTGLSTLVCPSDPAAADGEDLHPLLYGSFRPPGGRQMMTSYVGNAGVLAVWVAPWDPGLFQLEQAHATGTIYNHSNIKLSDIPDGTSTTMLFSERDWSTLKTLNATNNWPEAKSFWNSGFWTHTTFNAGAPPNYCKKHPEYFAQGTWWWLNVNASSNHPDGVNVAFTDGSVRFVKDSIASWRIQGIWPLGLPFRFPFDGDYGTATPRTWQAIATRNGAEVISPGAY